MRIGRADFLACEERQEAISKSSRMTDYAKKWDS
jgi:hypothetical protein